MKPKIILLGAGNFGKNHFRNLLKLHKQKIVDFIGVVDTDQKILDEINLKYKLQTSKNHKKFIKIADAFHVVTPASTHYGLVKELLKNKKHVFVEKPLTLNSKSSQELAMLAKKNKVILQVGHIFRFNSSVNLLKKIIQTKENTPYFITGQFLQSTNPKSDVGAIFNYLHLIDILDNIIGKSPKKIFSYSNLQLNNPQREINANISVEYTKKLHANLNVGWIPTGKYRMLEIFTNKEHIKCDLLKQKVEIYRKGLLKKEIIFKHEEPLYLEIKDFLKCMKKKTVPKADGFIGTKIVKIAEIAKKSSESGKIINFV